MIRLFSSFDLFFRSFLYSSVISLALVVSCITFFYSGFKIYLFYWFNFFVSFFSSILENKVKIIDFVLAFFAINLFIFNFFSVGPYYFSLTSQIRIVLFLSFRIWGSIFGFYFLKNFKGSLSHIVPEGTPLFLVWFIFLIEIIRNLIRPLTLIVRLVANILAGHLLIILLSFLVWYNYLTFIGYLILNIVEIFVSLIQCYIFVTITYLYYSEIW